LIPSSPSPGTFGSPIPGTSLDGSPGGLPLYKNGILVGGIGVTGDGTDNSFPFISGPDTDEDVALSGQHGYAPSSSITADNVFLGAIRLPYVSSSTSVSSTITLQGNYDPMFPPQASPGPPPEIVPGTFAGVPVALRQPIIS